MITVICVVIFALIYGVWSQTNCKCGPSSSCKSSQVARPVSNSTCAGDMNQCCDRSCETQTKKTCGDGNSCVEVTTITVTTPSTFRTQECKGSVTKGGSCSDGCSDCEVSRWSDWDTCSKSCGPGTKKRRRTVTTPKTGDGQKCPSLEEQTNCKIKECPIDCTVTDWSGWNECNQKGCGEFAVQLRQRAVITMDAHGGDPCPALRESRSCNLPPCQTPHPPTQAPTPRPTPAQATPKPTPVGGTTTASQTTLLTTTTILPTPAPPTPLPSVLVYKFTDPIENFSPGQPSIPINGGWIFAGSKALQEETVEVTQSTQGVGARKLGSMQTDGLIEWPNTLEIISPDKRALKSLILNGFDNGESGMILCYNPLRKRVEGADPYLYYPIQIDSAQPANLAALTGRGYTNFEIAPDKGSAFGVQQAELAELDPNFIPTIVQSPESVNSGEDNGNMLIWILIGVGACVCLTLTVVVVLVVVLRGGDDDYADEDPVMTAMQGGNADSAPPLALEPDFNPMAAGTINATTMTEEFGQPAPQTLDPSQYHQIPNAHAQGTVKQVSASQYGPTGGVADQYSNVAEAMPSGYDRLANDGTQYDVVDEPNNVQYGGLDNSGNETQIQYSHGVY